MEPGNFDSTRWTLIEQVQGDSPTLRREALEQLLARYVPALQAHLVVRRRIQPQDAADLVQDFVTNKILERDLVSRADRARGKFRGFLLTALDRYLVDWIRYNRAQKRSAEGMVSIDEHVHPPAADEADVFDVAWGQAVLGEAIKEMHLSCRKDGAENIWKTFYLRILRPLSTASPPVDYAELVQICGFESPRQASNALVTARRRFNRCLRQVVAGYTQSDDEITEEISELQRIVSSEDAWSKELVPRDVAEFIADDSADQQIEGTLGRDVADLLAADPADDPEWGVGDYGPLLQHLLATPIREVLLWPDVPASIADWADRSLADLFVSPQPPLELLEEAKRTGQKWAREPHGIMPPDLGATIYFISIAVALIRHDTRISSSQDATLAAGLKKLVDCPWMDPGLGDLMRRAIAQLRPQGG